MKLSSKQLQEIDFLEKHFDAGSTTQEEREEYIQVSVLGEGSGNVQATTNPLLLAKRRLDINIKMWRKDISDGMFWYKEFTDDFNHPYAEKLFRSIVKGITFDYSVGHPVFHLLNMLHQRT